MAIDVVRSVESPTVAVNKRSRTVRAIVGSEDLDRHFTIIDPCGMDLTTYRTNPVVLVNHGSDPRYGSIPVATSEVALISYPAGSRRSAIEAHVKFRSDPLSNEVWESYADGTMRGFSVNVQGRAYSPPTKHEVRARPELAQCQMIYRESSLLELSAVAVPSNPAALAQEVMRSTVRDLPSAGVKARQRDLAQFGEEVVSLVRRALDDGIDPAEVAAVVEAGMTIEQLKQELYRLSLLSAHARRENWSRREREVQAIARERLGWRR